MGLRACLSYHRADVPPPYECLCSRDCFAAGGCEVALGPVPREILQGRAATSSRNGIQLTCVNLQLGEGEGEGITSTGGLVLLYKRLLHANTAAACARR